MLFAEIDDGERVYRVGGVQGYGELVLDRDEDVTNALLAIAHELRETNHGTLFGDLRMDISRWDFYAAPFRIELADDLRRTIPLS